jgi:tetratricopeptide (TPR) repeat protein
MLDFLKRIFNSSERRAGKGTAAVMASEDLGRIEEELAKIGHGYEAARLLNRAGDLYLVKGDRQSALKRYGDAIDAYLQSGEYDNAMAVCRKIIRVVPEVIRTRRTLAWLCLGKGFLEIAREHIEAYTSASIEANLEGLAVQHLQLMSQYVERADFREFLADKLAELGDKEAAEGVRAGRASEGVRAAGWQTVVFAAMLTPEELRRAADSGIEIQAPTEAVAGDEFEQLLFDPDTAKGSRGRSEQDSEDAESEEDGDKD